MAAFPYQPSSVYLAQSKNHGEWFGKSARRLQRMQHREAADQNQPGGVKPAFGRMGQWPFLRGAGLN